jgi:hypothetical protein
LLADKDKKTPLVPPALSSTSNRREFAVPDRSRFNLNFSWPEILPSVMLTLPVYMADVESLLKPKRDPVVLEWTLRDSYRVKVLDALKENYSRENGHVSTFSEKFSLLPVFFF